MNGQPTEMEEKMLIKKKMRTSSSGTLTAHFMKKHIYCKSFVK
jgi:hypothetical protein